MNVLALPSSYSRLLLYHVVLASIISSKNSTFKTEWTINEYKKEKEKFTILLYLLYHKTACLPDGQMNLL